jgi:hypothetical protein
MATPAQWACRIGASDRTYLYGVAGRPYRPAIDVSGDLTDQFPSRARDYTDLPNQPAQILAYQSPLTCIAGRRPANHSFKDQFHMTSIRQAHKQRISVRGSGVAVLPSASKSPADPARGSGVVLITLRRGTNWLSGLGDRLRARPDERAALARGGVDDALRITHTKDTRDSAEGDEHGGDRHSQVKTVQRGGFGGA